MPADITTAVNRPAIPYDGATVTAEVEVRPTTTSVTPARLIAICLDVSGSMDGEKLAHAIDGAEWVFGLLEDRDYLAIVAFDSTAQVVLHPTRWGGVSRTDALDRVEDLEAGGRTNVYEGLQTARETVTTMGKLTDDEDVVRRVLLLSDGRDSERESGDFASLAEAVDRDGIRIEAAGIGEDYDEETIRTLGRKARGEWRHLGAPGDIEAFFGDVVESASQVVAPEASLELDLAPGVAVEEVYRALPQAQAVDLDRDGDAAVVKLPDLVDRERQVVVLKLAAPARSADGDGADDRTLADVTLSAGGDRVESAIGVTYTDDAEELARHNESVSLDHRGAVIRTALGEGDVGTAETEIEKMTQIHGADTRAVTEVRRQTELVKEGGRAEQNRATKIVDGEGVRN